MSHLVARPTWTDGIVHSIPAVGRVGICQRFIIRHAGGWVISISWLNTFIVCTTTIIPCCFIVHEVFIRKYGNKIEQRCIGNTNKILCRRATHKPSLSILYPFNALQRSRPCTNTSAHTMTALTLQCLEVSHYMPWPQKEREEGRMTYHTHEYARAVARQHVEREKCQCKRKKAKHIIKNLETLGVSTVLRAVHVVTKGPWALSILCAYLNKPLHNKNCLFSIPAIHHISCICEFSVQCMIHNLHHASHTRRTSYIDNWHSVMLNLD